MFENGFSNKLSKSSFTSQDCELAPPNKGENPNGGKGVLKTLSLIRVNFH